MRRRDLELFYRHVPIKRLRPVSVVPTYLLRDMYLHVNLILFLSV